MFSSEPYEPPSQSTGTDLKPHLTNTCLQEDHGEQNVRLLDELIGCQILSDDPIGGTSFTADDVSAIKDRVGAVACETFKAALQFPIHFQARFSDLSPENYAHRFN